MSYDQLPTHDTSTMEPNKALMPDILAMETGGELLADYEGIHGIEKYNVDYENETILIDSNDWRSSALLKLQIIASYTVFILFGLGEQAVGTLIPKLQIHYDVNDIQISMIFLSTILGYFIMALLTDYCHKRVGIKGVVILGCSSMALCELIVSAQPPYFILLLAFVLNGLGMGSLDAALNGWMGNLVDSNQLLGIMHGCYGIGCMISPAVITNLLERENNPWTWNQIYIVLSILGCFNLMLMIITFRYETPKKYKYVLQMKSYRSKLQKMDPENDTGSSDDGDDDSEVTLKEAIQTKLIWVFSTILFIYVGGEVAFGEWLVTFLMRIKQYSYKKSSYMASFFWFGLTTGRIVLGFATASYFTTELTANFTYIISSFVGYLLFWVFSWSDLTFILFGVVFLTGMAVGPIFPTTIVSAIKILPGKYHTAGVGFICAFGGGGAAGIPFLIGLIAESSDIGLKILPVIIMALYGILLLMWLGIIRTYAANYSRNTI